MSLIAATTLILGAPLAGYLLLRLAQPVPLLLVRSTVRVKGA